MTESLTIAANKLWEVQQLIKAHNAAHDEQMAPFLQSEEKLREDVLKALQDSRLKAIKIESGESYARVVKAHFEITNEDSAMRWAKKMHCIRIDKTLANKLLLRTPKVPAGFQQVDEEHLRVIKPNSPGM